MLVSVCFFLSGAAALILQVLWTRMLGHIFGATALAVSTTLTAFMGGLALGAMLGGRFAPKLKRPVLAFAALETTVGLYGLLVPFLFELLPAAQRAVGLDLRLGFIGFSLIRFVIVALILILPTTAMGATLPILAEAVVKRGPDVASKVGKLYTANTFGAVFGAMLAGFVLIPGLGIKVTVTLAAAIDLSVAAIVVGLFRLSGGDELLTRASGPGTADEILTELEPVAVLDVSPRGTWVALLAFALSGAAAMSLEVLWNRTVSVVIGASTHAFTLILATFLVGLTVGAAMLSRRVDRIAEPIKWLAWVQLAVGICAALGTLLVDQLPSWLHAASRSRDATMGGIYFTSFLISAAVMLPATIALGAVMPLVVRILAPAGALHAGPVVARAYTLNTLGAIVGSFAGGFILLPVFGVQTGLNLAAGLSISVGILLALNRVPRVRAAVAVGLIGLALLALLPRWNVSAWTAGLFRFYLVRNVYAEGWKQGGKLAYHKDGISSTVTVETGDDGNGVSLKVNGKVDASDSGDMPTQILSGLLPMLVHPKQVERVLVIGYGSGVTSGAALEAPVKELDLVEIETAVYEAANRFFAHVNHKPFEDPRFKVIIDDGRNYMLTRDQSFDLIISEPSNPWMSGASSLFTEDFFRLARRRLKDDGLFLQWLQLYELAPGNIQTLFRTFHAVFDQVLVFTPSTRSNDTLVVGSNRGLKLDRARVQAALDDPRLGPELRRANIRSPEDFLGLFLLGTDELGEFAGKGPINTDDNALIEFSAPKDLLEYSTKDAELPFLSEVEGKRLGLIKKYMTGFPLDSPRFLARGGERLLRQGRLEDALAFVAEAKKMQEARTGTAAEAAGVLTATSALEGAELAEWKARLNRIEATVNHLEEGDREAVVVATEATRKDPVYARAVMTMLDGHDREALRMVDAEQSFEKRSTGHRFLYAYLCYRADPDLDSEFLVEGVLKDKDFTLEWPSVWYYAAPIEAGRGRYDLSADYLARYLELRAKAVPEPSGER